MNFITETKTASVVTGYLIFSFIFSVLFSLYFQDPLFYAFTLFILMALVLANSIDVGDINKDLASVGWSSTNITTAIPLGVLGGIIALVLGSFVVNINMMNSTIPDLTSIAKFFTKASIISPLMAVSANLFAQWLVITPAEESLKLIIAPYAGMLVFKNKIIAFFIGILLWELMHVPTYIMQGVGTNMYFVLFILGVITAFLYFLTSSILAPLTAHGTFNTAIILSSAQSNVYDTFTILIIVAVLVLVWLKNSQKNSQKMRSSKG